MPDGPAGEASGSTASPAATDGMAGSVSGTGAPGSTPDVSGKEDMAPLMDAVAATGTDAAAGAADRHSGSKHSGTEDGLHPADLKAVDSEGRSSSRPSATEIAQQLRRSLTAEAQKQFEVKSNRHHIMLQLLESDEEYLTSSSSGHTAYVRRCRQVATRIVFSQYFDLIMALVVGLNCFIMALESEIPDAESFFIGLDWIFNVIYTVEAFMRWSVYRHHYFKSAVNVLDLIIVISGWVTSFAILFESDGKALNSVAALKVLRALRALRFCRMISFFEGIWIVFSSFMRCMKPLFWTCLFVAVIIFIFTMFAVELIGTSDVFDGVEQQKWFEGTVICFTTLFQVMTLDEWRSVTQPICDRAWWTYIFFLIYISVAALALMNLVTAVIVENAMLTIREDEETKKRELKKYVETQKEKMLQLFKACHRKTGMQWDKSALHSAEFMVTADDVMDMKYYWGILQAILESFAIETTEDIDRLLTLLDTDGNGAISLNEMLEGIIDLRSVMEDHNRIALMHTTKNRDHKFQIIERLIAQKRAPEICIASLGRMERYFDAIGLKPQPDEMYSETEAESDREEPVSMPSGGFDEADACAGCGATAVAQSSFGDPRDSSAQAGRQIINTPSANQLLLQRLRKLRFGLQRQGKELKEHRQEIERLEMNVDQMLRTSPRLTTVNPRPGSPPEAKGGTSRVPPAAPRSTLDETPPT